MQLLTCPVTDICDDAFDILDGDEFDWSWSLGDAQLARIRFMSDFQCAERQASVNAASPCDLPPIILRDNGDGTYLLLDGGHRVRKAQSLGHTTIRAVVGFPNNHE